MRSIPFNAARPQQPPGRFYAHLPSPVIFNETTPPQPEEPSPYHGSKNNSEAIPYCRQQKPKAYVLSSIRGHHCSKANCGIAGEHDRGFPACLFTRLSTCYAAWLPAYFTCLSTLSPAAISWGLAALTHAAEPPSHDALLQVPRTYRACKPLSGIINRKQHRTGRTAHDHQCQHYRRPPP